MDAEDAAKVLLSGAAPAWLDTRRRAVAALYRAFERHLIALLRRYDRHRDPGRIHPLVPADHLERVRAFERFRLEECLYPQYRWVVPLYDPDTRWEWLLEPLRAIEAMMLHLGEGEEGEATRGSEALVDCEAAVEVRVVDEPLPTDRGARLLEVDTHDDGERVRQLSALSARSVAYSRAASVS